jgi:hypothetical protein
MKNNKKYIGLVVIVTILLLQVGNVIPSAHAQTRDQRDFNAAKGAATGAGLMGAAGAGFCMAVTYGGCGAVVAAGAILGLIGGTMGAMGTPDDFSIPPGQASDMPDWVDPYGDMPSGGGIGSSFEGQRGGGDWEDGFDGFDF